MSEFRKIKVLAKRPDSKPYMTWISDSLKNLQTFVGGPIEVVPISEDLIVVCNEEGRLRDLEYNCEVCGIDFVGTIFFCGVDGEEFTDVPLNIELFKCLFPRLWERYAHV